MVATIWPFGPNIRRSPYQVIREYRTDIIVSRAGKEQRRALRQTPRKRIEYLTAQTEGCLREFDRSMVTAQRTLLAIAERVRFVTLASGLAGGATSVIISPLPDWIEVGGKLMLYAPDRYGLRTVESVVGTIVTFEEFDALAWPAGTRLHPWLEGYLDTTISAPVVAARGVVEASVVFHIEPGSETEESAGAATTALNGREVFLTRPDKWEPIDLGRVQEGVGQVDYGFGRVKRFFPIEFATRMWDAQYTRCDSDHAESLRQFFTRMQGRRGEFYMPTWQEDLVPFAALTAAGTTITVEGTETDSVYSGDTVFNAVAVKLADGSWLCRTVVSIATSGGNSVLTVNAAWGQDVALADIVMVCWLPVWRFATDILTFSWPRDDVAQLTLAFQMLESLAVEEISWISDEAPVLLSPTSYSVDEGQPLDTVFEVSMPVAGILFDGGADDEFFKAPGGPQTEWIDGFLPDFDSPQDADAGNTYVERIIFVGENGINSIPYTITWTIENVSPVSVGAASLTIDVVSDTELRLNASATNAETFEYEKNASGIWLALAVGGIVPDLTPNHADDYRVRGRAGGDIGAPSASVEGITLAMPALYNPNAVTFDGATWLTLVGSLTGVSDGKQGALVLQVDPTGGNGATRHLHTNTSHFFSTRLQTNNKLKIIGLNAAGATILQMVTKNTFLANSGFKQIRIHFHLGLGLGYIKVNGVLQELDPSLTILTDDNIDFTRAGTSFGAAVDGSAPFTGRASDSAFHPLWMADTLENDRKFIGSDGRVRDPGADGSGWFGVAAAMLFRGLTATWHTNDGTGGGFTLNGTLTQAAVGPNGSLAPPPFSILARKADDFIKFQSVQYNRNWNLERWTNNDSEAYLAATFLRKVRGQWGQSDTRAVANRIYANYGIKVSSSFNPINTDGTFNLTETDRLLNDLKADSGINNPMGLEKLFAIEAANEYTLKHLQEYIVSVDVAGDTLTLTGQGAPSRNQTTLSTVSKNPAWCVNGAILQLRSGTISGRTSANTGTPPGGLAKDTPYYIRDKTVVGGAARFKLAISSSGAALPISSSGTLPANAHHIVSPWAPRLRAYQTYLFNKIGNDPTYAAWLLAGGYRRGPTIWGRCRIDYEALGNTDHIQDVANIHLYNAARRPDRYNGVTGDDPMLEALIEGQRGGSQKVDVTEWAQDFANSFGGTVTVATTTELVASKYLARGVCEFWLQYLAGYLGLHDYFAFLDSNAVGEYQGLLSYNEGTNVYTERLPYWTWRNLNSKAVDATWDGNEWDEPVFTPGSIGYDISPSDNPDIKHFALEKEDGSVLFLIWRNWTSYERGNPGEETTQFTANAASDELTVHERLYADHVTGDACSLSSTGTLPGNTSAGTIYFIIKTATPNKIKIADSLADALAEIPRNISSAGSGNHTITPRIAVELTVATPAFSEVNAYETTVLPGESANSKRDNPTFTSGSPHDPFNLYVPDHPIVAIFTP